MMPRAQGLRCKGQARKKKNQSLILSLSCALVSLCPCALFAHPISSVELINNAKKYDGQTVIYEGEVIGDTMARQDYAWVNIKEGENAIGVWISRSLLKDISFTGNYKAKGDAVEVMGVLRRVCPEHGGDMDIHAQTLRLTDRGRNVVEKLNTDKRNMVIGLLGVLCLLWILSRFIHK